MHNDCVRTDLPKNSKRRRLPVEDRLRIRSDHWPEAVTPIAHLMMRVYRVGGLIYANSMELAGAHALSSAEFEVLVTLRGVPAPHELMPTELYDAVLMSSGGLTKVLYGLERRGTHHSCRRQGRPQKQAGPSDRKGPRACRTRHVECPRIDPEADHERALRIRSPTHDEPASQAPCGA